MGQAAVPHKFSVSEGRGSWEASLLAVGPESFPIQATAVQRPPSPFVPKEVARQPIESIPSKGEGLRNPPIGQTTKEDVMEAPHHGCHP